MSFYLASPLDYWKIWHTYSLIYTINKTWQRHHLTSGLFGPNFIQTRFKLFFILSFAEHCPNWRTKQSSLLDNLSSEYSSELTLIQIVCRFTRRVQCNVNNRNESIEHLTRRPFYWLLIDISRLPIVHCELCSTPLLRTPHAATTPI